MLLLLLLLSFCVCVCVGGGGGGGGTGGSVWGMFEECLILRVLFCSNLLSTAAIKYALMSENVPSGICAQRRFRSVICYF